MLFEGVGHLRVSSYHNLSLKQFLLLILIPLTANAWTRTSDQQIASRAALLVPRDLRLVIYRFQPQYMAGIDRALADEKSDPHRTHLRERIEKETAFIVDLLRTKQPMPQVVFRLGILAHLIGDANNPFHVTKEESLEPAHVDFEHYF